MDTKIAENNLDREVEKLLKDMSGSAATWVEYREAILDAIERSGILETLGDGTEEEHNAKLQLYIEKSLKRLSAKAWGRGGEFETETGGIVASVMHVTDKLNELSWRAADLHAQLAESSPDAKAKLEDKISNLMDATNFLSEELCGLVRELSKTADATVPIINDPIEARKYVENVNKAIAVAERVVNDVVAVQGSMHGGDSAQPVVFSRVTYDPDVKVAEPETGNDGGGLASILPTSADETVFVACSDDYYRSYMRDLSSFPREQALQIEQALQKIKNDQTGMAQNQPWPSSSAEKAAAAVRCAPPVPPRLASTTEKTEGMDSGAIGCVVIVIIGVIIYVLC